MTRIFCDIADLNLIKKFDKKKIVKGFTTNPTLIRKAGARNYLEYSKKIAKLTTKPISCEVFADDLDGMIFQGLKINNIGSNIYVKIPVTTSKGKFTGKVIQELNKKKIKININAVYNVIQVKNILKSINKKISVIISIFAGRMSDTGIDPTPIIKKSIKLAKNYPNVQILWASTREAYNYLQAKKLKCHIITVPPSIITKIENFGKTSSELTIDTVKGFLEDSTKSKFKI